MTQNEIAENNALIATLRGWKQQLNTNERWYSQWFDNHGVRHSELKFEVDWGFLMDTVEFIERLDDADTVVLIQDDTCTIHGGDFKLTVDDYDKKTSVYKAVVEFAKWYLSKEK